MPTPDWSARDLGTPRIEHSKQANRMSPAGIPMFYGASDSDTAIRETLGRATATHVTAAAFAVGRTLSVIDLTNAKLPLIPSQFDIEKLPERDSIQFLHDFTRRLSEPIRETYEQVDYVPTQVLTEYLLKAHARGEESADGLMYSSAITGKPCVVLNIPNSMCVDRGVEVVHEGFLRIDLDKEAHLVMDPESIATYKIGRTYS